PALTFLTYELVLCIVPLLCYYQTARLDLAAVVIPLSRAAYACGPQCGVTYDGVRQLRLCNDVGKRQPSARLQQSGRFAKYSGFIRCEVDHAVANDGIGRTVGQRHLFYIALQKFHGHEAITYAQPLGLGALLVCHVDAKHLAARTDLHSSD